MYISSAMDTQSTINALSVQNPIFTPLNKQHCLMNAHFTLGGTLTATLHMGLHMYVHYCVHSTL